MHIGSAMYTVILHDLWVLGDLILTDTLSTLMPDLCLSPSACVPVWVFEHLVQDTWQTQTAEAEISGFFGDSVVSCDTFLGTVLREAIFGQTCERMFC